ncbi:MAG TPA: GNAT family N-acetyltransferase [Puia sp.]|nr:GNAT family N-acetyltransferase [Puia sp.]
MTFHFTYELSPEQKEDIRSFYDSLDWVTLEQYPDFAALGKGNFTHCFFMAREEKAIVCWAIITERKARIFRFAHIQFGPLFRDPEDLIASLQQIDRHYREKGDIFLTVQLALPTGATADYIEYKLNRDRKIRSYFDRENWSSLVLSLQPAEEEIRRNFSKGHKSDLKKAEKSEISITSLSNFEELEAFCRVFNKMNRERGLAVDEEGNHAFFRDLYGFLQEQRKGDFHLVKDRTGQVLGGIVILYQGHTVRYFKGASDPAQRQLPILHLAIWEGIKKAKALGFRHFDLWGYNHFVTEKDQVFFINRFKKGFGGEYLFYPKKMYFIYRPMMHRLYKWSVKLYQRIR